MALWRLLIPLFVQLIGLGLFLIGFFPPKISIQPESVPQPQCEPNPDEPHLKKLVFVVIDGWRSDFLFNENHEPDTAAMPFLTKALKLQTIPATSFLCHVQHPTVTMPRLKAILSGIVPSYLDVAMNLASTELTEDNWLSKAAALGKKTIFFGDDTWMKLFPEESKVLLPESEGTVSFFVTDYTEVDDNVTRHLPTWISAEKAADWDIMILHYLGLDHIGHSLGAKSSQIDHKLKEMDSIVQTIYKNMEKEFSDPYAIVVVGDHGMAEEGGHGGSSYKESHVPVVVLFGPETDEFFPQPSLTPEKIEQIDLAPSLSILLNQRIPLNSMGVSFLDRMSFRPGVDGRLIGLNALMKNANQLKPIVETYRDRLPLNTYDDFGYCLVFLDKKACGHNLEKGENTHTTEVECRKVFQKVQTELIQLSSVYKYEYLLPGLLLAIISVLALSFMMDFKEFYDFPELLLIIAQPCIAFASSFVEEEKLVWYFLFPTFCILSFRRKYWCGIIAIVFHRILTNLRPVLFTFFASDISTHYRLEYLSYIPLFLTIRKFIDVPFSYSACLCLSLLSEQFDASGAFLSINGILLIVFYINLIVLCVINPQNGLLFWVLSLASPANRVILGLIVLFGTTFSKHQVHSLIVYCGCMTSFYYTGNSHSLATIDLSSAYSRLPSYHPIAVGIQLILTSYSGPIVFLLSVYHGKEFSQNFIQQIQFARCSSLTASLIALFHHRHHLFVWSVFAPKIVYDIFHLAVTALLLHVFVFFQRIHL